MMQNLKMRLQLMATFESHKLLVGENKISAKFSQLLLVYKEKQHDTLLIEGSKNGSLNKVVV